MAELSVGFVGLGAMGSGLAHNLQAHLAKNGQSLLINNRTKDKSEVQKLLSEGATWAESPADLASNCDVVFSMLTADSALEAVFSNYLTGKPKAGNIYIDCSTVFPDLTEKLVSRAKEAGVTYLACNIVGRPDATLDGKSLIIAAGNEDGKAKVKPLLEVMGRRVIDAGPNARQGNALKLTANYFIAGMLEMIAEGMTLTDKNDIPRASFVSLIKEMFGGPITAGYAERTSRDEFALSKDAPGFSARGGLKDVTHVQNLAKASGVPMPVGDILVKHFEELNRRGDPDSLEWGSSALLIRERAGIEDTQKLLK